MPNVWCRAQNRRVAAVGGLVVDRVTNGQALAPSFGTRSTTADQAVADYVAGAAGK
jgi:hypothetical protein